MATRTTLAVLFVTTLCPTCAAQHPAVGSGRVVAPRLPHSPFPVSAQPERIFLLNLTGTSFDYRVAALSAVGVVAQRCPELATFDDGDFAGPPGAGSSMSLWQLRLLPAVLDLSLQFELAALIARFQV